MRVGVDVGVDVRVGVGVGILSLVFINTFTYTHTHTNTHPSGAVRADMNFLRDRSWLVSFVFFFLQTAVCAPFRLTFLLYHTDL